jgi:hypothetical protein
MLRVFLTFDLNIIFFRSQKFCLKFKGTKSWVFAMQSSRYHFRLLGMKSFPHLKNENYYINSSIL